MTESAGFLAYGRHSIDQDDVAAVIAVLQSDWLTSGPQVEIFEQAFCTATGASDAVACNSGTAALHLAALALKLGPGDAAVVPTMTFLATANVIRMTGAEVVFADVDPDTGLMTPATLLDAVERAKNKGLTPKTAWPVHLNGQVCDMAALAATARPAGLNLVEDACHALGVPMVGSNEHSVLACFSTHPVKAIATGEGGLVTTRDEQLAQRMRELRTHGMVRAPDRFLDRGLGYDRDAPNPWYYEMHEVGWNYRIPDLLCALGTNQLRKLPGFYRRRQDIAAHYDRLLAPLAPAIRPVPHGIRPHGWHLYALLVDFAALGMSRRTFMNALREREIGTQVHYIPVHRQPYYRARYGELALSGADAYYARCLSIPLFPAMTNGDATRVAAVIADVVRAP